MDNYVKIEKIGEGELYGKTRGQVVSCIASMEIDIYRSLLGNDLTASSVT